MVRAVQRAARWAVLALSAAVALLELGIYRQTEGLARPFAHAAGYSYARQFIAATPLPWLLHTVASFDDKPWASRLVLLEDGRALQRDDYHANIKDLGTGRFSHWGSGILFSASDNSDPNRNGRTYAVEYPVVVRWDAAALLVICFLLLDAFLVVGGARKRGQRLSAREPLLALLSARPMPEKMYWTLFALILGGGIAFRIFWTSVLEVPYVYPDSWGYYAPVFSHPFLPFSEMRTGGVPMFIAAALALFRAPIGLLLMANALAVVCASALALAIKAVLRQKALSLFALFLFLFIPKNVAFEYTLLSEHFSRCLYLASAACLLWLVAEPRRYWLSGLLGLLVTLNVLVKPSALVLGVAVPLALAGAALSAPRVRRTTLLLAAATFLAMNVTLITAYMAAFQQRFGTFGLTHFDGYNLFYHVGHMTVLDGGVHPELKQRLKPLLSTYVDKYVRNGRHEQNWLVYGSATPDMAADFGGQSPMSMVFDYVGGKYGGVRLRDVNQVYRDLAIEAIKANWLGYLRYAVDRGIGLWEHGYALYYVPWPDLALYRDAVATQREMFYQAYGQGVPGCGAPHRVPAAVNALTQHLFRGAFAPCATPRYHDNKLRERSVAIAGEYNGIMLSFSPAFVALPGVGFGALVLGLIILPLSHASGVQRLFGFGMFLAMVTLGYSAFLGLVNASDVGRMTTNVQDLVVLMFLAFIGCALMQVRDLTHRLLSSGSKPRQRSDLSKA